MAYSRCGRPLDHRSYPPESLGGRVGRVGPHRSDEEVPVERGVVASLLVVKRQEWVKGRAVDEDDLFASELPVAGQQIDVQVGPEFPGDRITERCATNLIGTSCAVG